MNVFVSYSQKDKQLVSDILKEISILNIRLFSDTDILAGENWLQRIKSEIEKSDIYLFFISDYINQSQFISSEISFAISEKHNKPYKVILPILIGQIKELPFFLGDFQYLDLSKKDSYSRNIDELKRIISSYMNDQLSYLSNEIDLKNSNAQLKSNRDEGMLVKAEYLNFARKQLENEIKQQEVKKKVSMLSINAVLITVLLTTLISFGLSLFSINDAMKDNFYYILFFILGVLVSFVSSLLYTHYIKGKINKQKNGAKL